ncbi:uncharacterized protein LOC132277257 [Cornus florida]|uniref:uncharacterized protein LOC132277257 n=1 Tax=Cornus florida TaxID=4283 RepID=UPI0028968B7D|nr:uncharacterized protein LOC132277257 [Cornus florida]
MAVNLLSFRPTGFRVCATSGHPNDSHRRRNSSSNWWTPLFGISSEPDYIDSKSNASAETHTKSMSDPEPKPSRSKFQPGCFTEDKAKQLRMMTTNTGSFHDIMYHSAIASRLASEFSTGSDL